MIFRQAKLTKAFWIWSEFSFFDTNYLLAIQDKVRSQLKSEEFKIHMTLAGPFYDIDSNSIQLIRDYCRQNSEVKINTLGYGCQSKFFQSIFISIDQSSVLDKLRNAMFECNYQFPNKNFYPHISLVYGNYKKEIKENIITTLPDLKSCMIIDKISIVSICNDISLWKVYESFSLQAN